MPAVLSFIELDAQYVELLPARTVLSMFSTGDGGHGANGTDSTGGWDLNRPGLQLTLVPGTPGVNGVSADD
jgi:hypothetical protein